MALTITFNRLSLIAQLEDILNKAVTLKAEYDAACTDWKKNVKVYEKTRKDLCKKNDKAASKFNKLSEANKIKFLIKHIKSGKLSAGAVPYHGTLQITLHSELNGKLPKAPPQTCSGFANKGKFASFYGQQFDTKSGSYDYANGWCRTEIPVILKTLALSNADTVTVDSTETFLQFLGK